MFVTTGSRRENDAARQHLAETGYSVFDGEIPVSMAYGMASDAGRAITETSFRSLNDRAAVLAHGMIERIAELQERRPEPTPELARYQEQKWAELPRRN